MIEEELLKKAQEGDYKSIEEVCARSWEPLYRFIYHRVQNREEAEDITQETYVRAFAFLQKGHEQIEKYISFLKTVSLNVLRDKWRKRKRQGTLVNIDDVSQDCAAIEDTSDDFAQRELIKSALSRLSKDQQTVIELRIVKGYSVAETARIMKKAEGAVRVLQYRALQNLGALLKNNNREKEAFNHE